MYVANSLSVDPHLNYGFGRSADMPQRNTEQADSGKCWCVGLGALAGNNTSSGILKCEVKLCNSVCTISSQCVIDELLNLLYTMYVHAHTMIADNHSISIQHSFNMNM